VTLIFARTLTAAAATPPVNTIGIVAVAAFAANALLHLLEFLLSAGLPPRLSEIDELIVAAFLRRRAEEMKG
jgi:hypothetical protein